MDPETSGTQLGSDAELITRVRTGDRAAFGELYRRHAGAATALARQFGRSATEADDLVSESFARVLDGLLAGGGPDTAFRAYLFTTLRHTAYDKTRKDRRLQFTDDLTAHEVAVDGPDPVIAMAESGLIGKAFASLPERWQTVLWHTQVEGQSPAEVGKLLGMAPNAVTSLAFRAREGLREAYLQAHLAETAAERCRATVDRLGAWARGGLSKREQAMVDAHLAECDSCTALAAELTEINSGLRVLLAPLLLGGLAAGYLATLGGVATLTKAGVLVGAGAAAGTGAAATGTTVGAVGNSNSVVTFLSRPWTIAAGVAAAAAAVVVAIVIATTGGSSGPDSAGTQSAAVVSSATGAGQGAGGGTGRNGSGTDGTGGTGAGAGDNGAGGTGGDGTDPNSTDPNGTSPNGTDPNGTSPNGTGPNGTSPNGTGAGTDPNGTDRNGTGTDPNAPNAADPNGTPPTGTDPNGLPGLPGDPNNPGIPGAPTEGTTPSMTSPPGSPPPTSGTSGTGTTPSGPSTTAPSTLTSAPPTSTRGTATTRPLTSPPPTTPPPTTPPPTSPPPTTPPAPPAPAALQVSAAGSLAVAAGGSASLLVTISNSGGVASVATADGLSITAPPGVTVSGLVTGLGLRASRSFAAAVPGCTPDGLITRCGLPAVPPGAEVEMNVTLAVAPETTAAPITVQAGGSTFAVDFAVDSGIAAFQVAGPESLVAGSIETASITADLVTGVTDAGPIRLPLRSGALWVVGYPATCVADAGELACTGTVSVGPDGAATADFGRYRVSALPSATTVDSLVGSVPHGDTVTVVGGGSGSPITPYTPGDPVTVAGPFGGTMVATQTMQCIQPFVPGPRSFDRTNCTMRNLEPDEATRTVTIPEGATVAWAGLTWLAGEAAAPESVNSVDLVVNGAAAPVDGVDLPLQCEGACPVARWQDVTAQLTDGGRIAVSGIDAALKRTSSSRPYPIAGWTLAVIWTLPGAGTELGAPTNTVQFQNRLISNTSVKPGNPDNPVETTVVAPGDPISQLDVVVWAADPYSSKSFTQGDNVLARNIDGVVDSDLRGTPIRVCAGFDLVRAGGTDGAPLSEPSAAVTFVNQLTGNTGDTLWIGSTFVVRSPPDGGPPAS